MNISIWEAINIIRCKIRGVLSRIMIDWKENWYYRSLESNTNGKDFPILSY